MFITLQKDSTMARLLFSAIFKAIFAKIEDEKTEREARETVDKINECLNNMLAESTQYHPPFLGCVLVGTVLKYQRNIVARELLCRKVFKIQIIFPSRYLTLDSSCEQSVVFLRKLPVLDNLMVFIL